ncbi:MAG: hypothetical protein KJ558_09380 [Gammaproteobacteria bacterium]|nr:hypothetical protein [Gammaproteobacteria bacterium]MBU1655017.1 hypothetical protein [Gammaproteobacteria bacterium]MBU1960038.1 hypothetical protein [Gammaproteobacteria bacterium]
MSNQDTTVVTLSGTPYQHRRFRPFQAPDRLAIRLGPAAGRHEGLIICGAKHFDHDMMRTVVSLGMDGTELVDCDLGYVRIRADVGRGGDFRGTGQFITGYYPGRVFRP